MSEPKCYCVVVEHKCERPIVTESALLTYDEADQRMREMAKNPNIIRVAMCRLDFINGNETMIEKELS